MKNSAALSVLGAGTLWGLIGLFVHILAGKGFDPLQITTLRVTTAMVLTGLIIGRRDAKLFAIAAKDSWLFFGNGIAKVAEIIDSETAVDSVKARVIEMCARFPLYENSVID